MAVDSKSTARRPGGPKWDAGLHLVLLVPDSIFYHMHLYFRWGSWGAMVCQVEPSGEREFRGHTSLILSHPITPRTGRGHLFQGMLAYPGQHQVPHPQSFVLSRKSSTDLGTKIFPQGLSWPTVWVFLLDSPHYPASRPNVNPRTLFFLNIDATWAPIVTAVG